MKMTKQQLKEMIKKSIKEKLNEKFNYSNDFVPDDIKGYASDIDQFLKETIKKARELRDKGEEMMRANVLSSYEVQERNRFLLYRVGFLGNLISSLISRIEDELRHG